MPMKFTDNSRITTMCNACGKTVEVEYFGQTRVVFDLVRKIKRDANGNTIRVKGKNVVSALG